MKTMRAYGSKIYSMLLIVFVDIMWVIYGCIAILRKHPGAAAIVFLIAIFTFAVAWVTTPRPNPDYWIKYGEGKIIVHRCSKIISERGGKFESREDEILLSEIKLYGASKKLLGSEMEIPLDTGRFFTLFYEYFFQLKDGRKIPFDCVKFTRGQLAILSRYIYKETGIKMTRKNSKK